MTNKRDYDRELVDLTKSKYMYAFDNKVMHPYMMDSFIPFFKEGNLLELGSYKGNFTKRLLSYSKVYGDFFRNITCVDASEDAINEAKKNKFFKNIKFINSTFENLTLSTRYENIILTHVLEHLDDPVLILEKINDHWLSLSGRLFIVCPNANAPSRQIAVKMGLISHNSAVTSEEAAHGHRITYTFDTLERDIVKSGLRIIHRSGIFFKALANFQWDKLLDTDIISQEYLDGCYQLGQQYPDLCASLFFVCETD